MSTCLGCTTAVFFVGVVVREDVMLLEDVEVGRSVALVVEDAVVVVAVVLVVRRLGGLGDRSVTNSASVSPGNQSHLGELTCSFGLQAAAAVSRLGSFLLILLLLLLLVRLFIIRRLPIFDWYRGHRHGRYFGFLLYRRLGHNGLLVLRRRGTLPGARSGRDHVVHSVCMSQLIDHLQEDCLEPGLKSPRGFKTYLLHYLAHMSLVIRIQKRLHSVLQRGQSLGVGGRRQRAFEEWKEFAEL